MIDIAALFNETTLRRCQDDILGNGCLWLQFLWCATVTLRPTPDALIYLFFFSRLVLALAGRDGASRGHFQAFPPWKEPAESETDSKNLKRDEVHFMVHLIVR